MPFNYKIAIASLQKSISVLPSKDYKAKVVFYTFLLLFLLLLFLILTASIPENPLTPKKSIKTGINLLFPQGWNFFTRSPKESTFDIYRLIKSGKVKKINLENSYYAMGISRKNRFISIQLSSILSLNKNLKWSKFSGDLNTLPVLLLDQQKIKNIVGSNYIPNDSYLLVENVILPWAWVSKVKNYKKQYKVAWVLLN